MLDFKESASQYVVESIPGTGSNVATDRIAKAAADDNTLLMNGNSTLVINPPGYETVPFDLSSPTFRPHIHLQGYSESSHGLSDTLLSVLATRSQEIAESLLLTIARRELIA
jgi:lysine/ornithine N-monooxygenase